VPYSGPVEPKPFPGIVPTRVALALAAWRGRRTWRDPAARDRARAAAEAIVGRGSQVDAVARAHLAATASREAFILRPKANRRVPVRGLNHLQAARSEGRGVVVSYCHAGPFPGFGATVSRCTPGVHCIVGNWMLLDHAEPGLQQRVLAWRSMFTAAGATLITARGSFQEAVELLGQGKVVMVAFDMAGPQQTQFLGRPVMLASGTARMAAASDALIVPAVRRLVRYRPRSEFSPALDSRDHDDWRSLHAALAGVHSRSILLRPGTLENPYRLGSWGHGSPLDWSEREAVATPR
jgi:lauroyl/myristoyl acyltransferase